MKAVCTVLAALAVLCATVSAEAHHSFAAQYDANKPVTLLPNLLGSLAVYRCTAN